MADPDQAHARLPHQRSHFHQDLRLDRHVERRGRFVADDQLRMVEEGDGDGHALAHATRQFVRIGVEPALRVGNADLGQRLDAALPHLLGAGLPWACMASCIWSDTLRTALSVLIGS